MIPRSVAHYINSIGPYNTLAIIFLILNPSGVEVVLSQPQNWGEIKKNASVGRDGYSQKSLRLSVLTILFGEIFGELDRRWSLIGP